MDIRSRLRREDGAAAVEFALIAGVLAMLLFGMLQFGLAFFQLQNLRAAAREGARQSAVLADRATVEARVVDASNGAMAGNEAAIHLVPDEKTCLDDEALDTTRVEIAVSELTGGLADIFTVDIPLMPTITISAPVYGEFRCEH
jgi:Flp pilus assembly protein TadG